MAHVSNLFIAEARRHPMKAIDQAVAIANRGFEKCIHGGLGSRRQVLLVDSETLLEFGLVPGILRENITTVGLNTAELERGQQLAIGGAVLEVTVPCEPCFRMDEIRMGLKQALNNRRGVLCKVLRGGSIKTGDRIELADVAAGIPSEGGTS